MNQTRILTACSTIATRARAAPQSVAEAPFPVEPGKHGVLGLERSQEVRAFRVQQHPRTAAMEEAILVREGLQVSRLEPAAGGNRAMAARLIEQMIEHVADRRLLGGDLENVGN